MSDANGIVLYDLFGLSQPLTKLIETVGCGIGKLYEPRYIERIAKAKAKEIETISGAISNNITLPMNYDNGVISISTKDANDLVIRAQNRFLFQEMKKQQNIESVVSNAYSVLKNVDSVSDTPVEADWISEFFDCVANVSAEKMQILWGKLLAGEVKQPGSFSLRTLDVLKRLSQKEALIFDEIAPYILQCKGDEVETIVDYFLLTNKNDNLLAKYGFSFTKIIALNDAGLISENSLISIGFQIQANSTEFIRGLDKSIEIKNCGNGKVTLTHPAYLLTEAGKELFPIVLPRDNVENADKYLMDCIKELQTGKLTTIISDDSSNINKISFTLVNND